MKDHIALTGSLKSTKPLKECSKCGQMSEQSDGVQMTPSKWRCAKCYRSYFFRK